MKRKKLNYVPGLISLIGLPVLFFFFRPEDKVEQTCVKMFLPSDQKGENGNIRFSRFFVYQSIENKKINHVQLNGIYQPEDMYLFNSKLGFIQREMERMQFTHDTLSVLQVEIGDENTYGDFMYLENLTMLYQIKRYAFVDNSFYFFSNPPAHYENLTITPFTPEILDIPNFKQPTKWEIFKRGFFEKIDEWMFLIRHTYLLTIGFVLLIFIPSIIWVIKYNSHRSQKIEVSDKSFAG